MTKIKWLFNAIIEWRIWLPLQLLGGGMSSLRVIELEGRRIVVDVEPAAVPSTLRDASVLLPEGSEPTGFGDRIQNASQMIEDTISSVVASVQKALKNIEPTELTVELAISFKGESTPIPVLVKIGSESSIKITAKWTSKP